MFAFQPQIIQVESIDYSTLFLMKKNMTENMFFSVTFGFFKDVVN